MNKAFTAGLILAGIIAVSGTSFAEAKAKVIRNINETKAAKAQFDRHIPPEPPRDFDGKRPPMMSRDRHHDDRHHGSKPDRRPHVPPHSMDRRPPEFDRKQPLQQGVEPRW